MFLNKFKKREKEEIALITFLKRTKDGKYARIDERQLAYSRIKKQREQHYTEEEYYYGIRLDYYSTQNLLTMNS